jgi:hypothetical protein
MNLREKGWDGMDKIDVGEDRDQWRALVNLCRRSLFFTIIVYLQGNEDFGLLRHYWNYLCLACKSMKCILRGSRREIGEEDTGSVNYFYMVNFKCYYFYKRSEILF